MGVNRSENRRDTGVIIGIILLGVLIIAVIGVVVFVFQPFEQGKYDRIGKKTYTYESTQNLNVSLDIYNDVGSLSLQYDGGMESLFKAKIVVYGEKNAKMSDATDFSAHTSNETVHIKFDSGQNKREWFSLDDMYYKLNVSLNPNASVAYNLETTTGEMDLSFDSTSTSTITKLNVSSTTGSTEIILGDNTVLTCQEANIEATTGEIQVNALYNVTFPHDIDWRIGATTGGISLKIAQKFVPLVNYTAFFDINATTGGISLWYMLDEEEFGVKITAHTDTGSVQIPGGGNTYTSQDYTSKDVKYAFNLDTTTGGITAKGGENT